MGSSMLPLRRDQLCSRLDCRDLGGYSPSCLSDSVARRFEAQWQAKVVLSRMNRKKTWVRLCKGRLLDFIWMNMAIGWLIWNADTGYMCGTGRLGKSGRGL